LHRFRLLRPENDSADSLYSGHSSLHCLIQPDSQYNPLNFPAAEIQQ
jgi:hypothetical protein